MKKQTPLAADSDEFEETQEPPPSGDAWAMGISATCSVMLRDNDRAQLGACVAAFLASGGTITQVPPEATSMRLECDTSTYTTEVDGKLVQREYKTFASRDMRHSEQDKRHFAHLKNSVQSMLEKGFTAAQIAEVMEVKVGQVQRAISEVRAGVA